MSFREQKIADERDNCGGASSRVCAREMPCCVSCCVCVRGDCRASQKITKAGAMTVGMCVAVFRRTETGRVNYCDSECSDLFTHGDRCSRESPRTPASTGSTPRRPFYPTFPQNLLFGGSVIETARHRRHCSYYGYERYAVRIVSRAWRLKTRPKRAVTGTARAHETVDQSREPERGNAP